MPRRCQPVLRRTAGHWITIELRCCFALKSALESFPFVRDGCQTPRWGGPPLGPAWTAEFTDAKTNSTKYLRGSYLLQVGKGQRAYERAKELVRTWEHMQLGWTQTTKPSIKPREKLCIMAQSLWLWNRFPLEVVYKSDKRGKFPRYERPHRRNPQVGGQVRGVLFAPLHPRSMSSPPLAGLLTLLATFSPVAQAVPVDEWILKAVQEPSAMLTCRICQQENDLCLRRERSMGISWLGKSGFPWNGTTTTTPSGKAFMPPCRGLCDASAKQMMLFPER
jgi:Domain of unknown function (DUF1990)